MTITMQPPQRAAVLDDLDFYWGDIFDFAFSRAKWTARTRDGDRTFLADSPEELRGLIETDHEAHPVPRRDTHKGRSAMDEATAGTLKELDIHWGEAYVITFTSHGWMARRRDNGRLFLASAPEDLEQMIEADSEAQSVRLGADVDGWS